jgi:hypothetical protein
MPANRSGQVLRDLGLTPNQVWGLARTNDEWSVAVDAALMAARRDDLEPGTNAAYAAGCVVRNAARISGRGWAGTGTSSERAPVQNRGRQRVPPD